MRDADLCPSCNTTNAPGERACRTCASPLYQANVGGLTIWTLGDVDPMVLTALGRRLGRRLGLPVVKQPALLAPALSHRPRHWRGISSNALLNQVHRRRRRERLVLGITEENIVPGVGWNYLFGLAYMEGRSAILSLHPLRADRPSKKLLVARAEKIALHELGHAVGLDHHSYEEDIGCLMPGNVEQDSLETVDEGAAWFCRSCVAVVRRALRR